MVRNKMKTTTRIPLIIDVVVPGDPTLKVIRDENDLSAEQNLKRRIDDVERAIGQDDGARLGRAHAIRSENLVTE